jgi:hypothetical protein
LCVLFALCALCALCVLFVFRRFAASLVRGYVVLHSTQPNHNPTSLPKMDKLKSFLKTPLGMITLVLVVIVLISAYASKIPGLKWLSSLGAKLPGSDAKAAATAA